MCILVHFLFDTRTKVHIIVPTARDEPMRHQHNDLTSSIHPRVVNGRTKHKKVNTCKTASPVKKDRLIEALSEHCERHPNDTQSNERLAKLLS
jgi:hypothetical protein